MPLYDWRCERCGATETTVAKPDESNAPPESEHQMPSAPYSCLGEWRRVYGAPTFRRGPNWNGCKGSW